MREIVCFLAFAAFSSCIITIGIAATKFLFWLQGIIYFCQYNCRAQKKDSRIQWDPRKIKEKALYMVQESEKPYRYAKEYVP